ncbi:molybdopterin molybdotransferase MoeA [Bacillus circulans]|uniref:Molybdopterin molybdenumtransferase n=1 Tax=Niallia circulans TaxID=1397 RepID=A0AA91Z0Z7_NIACI|nr:gephyrin-like molybdotransferase Glp [Niallia circulans]NRG25702.1 molybdopterin molybdotransferase MoeA [Niallia circulans]PAD83512.1 molybdopterin molybdenumtransferase [Niallia circulans]
MTVENRVPILIEEAISRVMEHKREGEKEYVSIYHCNGRYLSEDIKAIHDVPKFNRSSYDGFAIRAKDTKGASCEMPVEFEIIDEIGAGQVSTKKIGEYQAIRIMTGAMLPRDADAVVMLEKTVERKKNGQTYIKIDHMLHKGENISFQGEDVKKGEVLLKKGTKINPGVVAVLATFGIEQVPVAKKPTIGLFATGTELLEVHEELEEGKIRNSNAYMILAQIERAGAVPRYFGKLPDVMETSFEAIRQKIDSVDMLITTGGVSVGDYDLLPEIYRKLGAEVLFNKIAMRPGSVTTVANLNGKLLFGLSGNPSACYVGFELFTNPIIKSLLFIENPRLPIVDAVLKENFPDANSFTRLIRSKVSIVNGKIETRTSGMDKSNIVSSLASANGLTILPGGESGYKCGDIVKVILLEEVQNQLLL